MCLIGAKSFRRADTEHGRSPPGLNSNVGGDSLTLDSSPEKLDHNVNLQVDASAGSVGGPPGAASAVENIQNAGRRLSGGEHSERRAPPQRWRTFRTPGAASAVENIQNAGRRRRNVPLAEPNTSGGTGPETNRKQRRRGNARMDD
ncbi:unnamed protein product [Arctogadus glacialis]